MKVAFYLRVSTDGQTVENQLRELSALADSPVNPWEITNIYQDHAISGAKSREDRPGFDQLLIDATRRNRPFDLVAAWSIDRLSRSLPDLISFLQVLRSHNVGLYLHKQNLDTTTPSGKAMFGMLGVFAEFEREMIRERVNAGLARAKGQGVRLGRPPISGKTKEAILADIGKLSLSAIAKKHKISKASVYRISIANENF